MNTNDSSAFRIALDAAPSVRHIDKNGFLHVAASHITKAQVVPYRGREIPAWEERGLDADRIYYAYRSPEELQKSLKTWNGLPLHIEHHIDSADDPQKLTRVGAVGTAAAWNAPYVDNALVVWDAQAIEGISDGSFKELSCAYRYEPDFTSGEADGVPYDFVMRNIKGNHVALVEKGRAGHDVVVADSAAGLTGGSTDSMRKRHVSVLRLADFALDEGTAVAGEMNAGGLIKCLTALESQLTGNDPADGGNEGVDANTPVEEIVEKYLPKLSEEKKRQVTELLTAVKDGGKEAIDTGGAEENPDEPQADEENVSQKETQNPEDEELADDEEQNNLASAMKDCGVDADDPDAAHAFEMGVKYGKGKGSTVEDEEDDGEDPAEEIEENSEEADDTNGRIQAIMKMLPEMDAVAKKKIMDALTSLAYADKKTDAQDEEPEDKFPAMDSRMKRARRGVALDADALASRVRAQMTREFKARSEAAREVRGVLGEIDVMAYDSAAGIYGDALKAIGVNPKKYQRSMWSAMFAAYQAAKNSEHRSLAMDSKPVEYSGMFANMANIQISQ